MKRRTVLSALLALTLAALLTACTGTPKAPEVSATPSPEPVPTAPPTPEPTPTPTPEPPVWSEQVIQRTFTAGDGTQVMQVSYTLPLIQNTDSCPAGTAINDWYKAEGSRRLAEAEENYEMVVADYDVSQASGFSFTPTTEEMTSQISYEDESVISVCRNWYLSSSAPYPTIFRLSEQFDAQTGTQLGSVDFFTDPDVVQERVVDAFLAQEVIRSGGFTRDQVTLAYQAEHFYLTDDGYVFWIQGNTLTGLHEPVEVTLSYDALKDVSSHG